MIKGALDKEIAVENMMNSTEETAKFKIRWWFASCLPTGHASNFAAGDLSKLNLSSSSSSILCIRISGWREFRRVRAQFEEADKTLKSKMTGISRRCEHHSGHVRVGTPQRPLKRRKWSRDIPVSDDVYEYSRYHINFPQGIFGSLESLKICRSVATRRDIWQSLSAGPRSLGRGTLDPPKPFLLSVSHAHSAGNLG